MHYLWMSLEAEVGVETNSFTVTASSPRGTGVPAEISWRCTRLMEILGLLEEPEQPGSAPCAQGHPRDPVADPDGTRFPKV